MLSDTDSQQGPTDGSFASTLSRLKQQGSSVLVVGSTQPAHRRNISQRLLGNKSDRVRRRILVSTTDGWDRSLITTPATPETFQTIQYRNQTRSAVTQPVADSSPPLPVADASVATADTLGELGAEISNAIETFETASGGDGFEPGELRVGIESLLPLLEMCDTEHVFKFIHLTNARITAASGMIYSHLPVDRDANIVSLLQPLFDICIELREQTGTRIERWSLRDSEHSTGWIVSPDR